MKQISFSLQKSVKNTSRPKISAPAFMIFNPNPHRNQKQQKINSLQVALVLERFSNKSFWASLEVDRNCFPCSSRCSCRLEAKDNKFSPCCCWSSWEGGSMKKMKDFSKLSPICGGRSKKSREIISKWYQHRPQTVQVNQLNQIALSTTLFWGFFSTVYFCTSRVNFCSLKVYLCNLKVYLYFESILLYLESIPLYFESIPLYFESILLYFESTFVYFESILLYFESILLYFESIL